MQAFQPAAVRARYDIDVLRSRFGVSFEQAANRLTTLQRPGARGVPFFMLEVDNAGNRFRRAGAQGFPQSRFGGGCPKLPVHAAFAPARPDLRRGGRDAGRRRVPDCIARTLEGPQGAFNERPRRTALLLGCDIGFRDEIVYGAALPWRGAGSREARTRSHRRRSARPAGSASAPAALPAPSRRSRARSAWTRW